MGVDKYARRLGLGCRTVRRLLRGLERRRLIVREHLGGGRKLTAVYRVQCLDDPTRNPANLAAFPTNKTRPFLAKNPANLTAETRPFLAKNPANLAAKEGCSEETSFEERSPLSPDARRENSNGDNGDDARLLRLLEQAKGRPLSGKERSAFVAAVGEAIRAGATAPLVGWHVQEAGADEPPWSGPNAAAAAAKDALRDFGRVCRRDGLTLLDCARLWVDRSGPDGQALAGDLEDLRKKHGLALAHATAWPAVALAGSVPP